MVSSQKCGMPIQGGASEARPWPILMQNSVHTTIMLKFNFGNIVWGLLHGPRELIIEIEMDQNAVILTFINSEKAITFCEISTVDLSYVQQYPEIRPQLFPENIA